jgi:hypothetical protein
MPGVSHLCCSFQECCPFRSRNCQRSQKLKPTALTAFRHRASSGRKSGAAPQPVHHSSETNAGLLNARSRLLISPEPIAQLKG